MSHSKFIFNSLAFLLLLMNLTCALNGQSIISKESSNNSSWSKISSFFSPPDEYKDKYGNYRSPLKFYDGNEVKNPADWKKRRGEILSKWHKMMGEWPPLIEHQKMEVTEKVMVDNYIRYKIKYNWLPGQLTEGYLLVPEGKGKRPAVITVYYEPETSAGIGDKEYRDFAHQLARRGFVTLSIGTSETTKAKTYSLYYPDIQNSAIQPLSVLACAAANSWILLSELPEVDPERIGIMGHSYGGKWAMFASSLFDKFACAVWSDPGIVFDDTRPNVNYWEPWYLGYYPPPWDNTWRKIGNIEGAKGLYPKLIAEGYDLHELHALMAPRPFLVSGGSEDGHSRWIPLNHAISVNKLLGYENRVGMTNRPEHSPNAESNEQIYSYFEYFLKKVEK
jgi:hypothetical protein